MLGTIDDHNGVVVAEIADIMKKDQEKVEHDVQKLKDRGQIYEMNDELRIA